MSLVETAFFDGDLEIPHIDGPEKIIIPSGIVPFSKRNRGASSDFVCFYENDINFDLDDGVKHNYALFQGVEVSSEGKKPKKIDLPAKI